jgi:hypothetical protein
MFEPHDQVGHGVRLPLLVLAKIPLIIFVMWPRQSALLIEIGLLVKTHRAGEPLRQNLGPW